MQVFVTIFFGKLEGPLTPLLIFLAWCYNPFVWVAPWNNIINHSCNPQIKLQPFRFANTFRINFRWRNISYIHMGNHKKLTVNFYNFEIWLYIFISPKGHEYSRTSAKIRIKIKYAGNKKSSSFCRGWQQDICFQGMWI